MLTSSAGVTPVTARGAHRGLDTAIQLGPAPLFRFYWRRQALRIRYPAPDEHVEDDTLALLRYVRMRARSTGGSAQPSQALRSARHRALADAAKRLMANELAAPHRIGTLARVLGTSPFHLAHVFRAQVGVSLHQFLLELRLVVALGELQAGSTDLSKLALDVVFSHHSHFSSVFRRVVGHSPREVRRMVRATDAVDLGIAIRQCG